MELIVALHQAQGKLSCDDWVGEDEVGMLLAAVLVVLSGVSRKERFL